MITHFRRVGGNVIGSRKDFLGSSLEKGRLLTFTSERTVKGAIVSLSTFIIRDIVSDNDVFYVDVEEVGVCTNVRLD